MKGGFVEVTAVTVIIGNRLSFERNGAFHFLALGHYFLKKLLFDVRVVDFIISIINKLK